MLGQLGQGFCQVEKDYRVETVLDVSVDSCPELMVLL